MTEESEKAEKHDRELAAEEEIFALLEKGDLAAFDLMVDRYAAMLYRYALRMCRDEHQAEDVVQETFLAAREKIGQFRGEGRLRNWLFRIATNACLQRHRAAKERLSRELSLEEVLPVHEYMVNQQPASWQRNPQEQLLSRELLEKLEEAIAKVPPVNRSALVLRDIEGLSTRETAQALGVSEDTVKVRLHRARAFVRKQLMEYFEEK